MRALVLSFALAGAVLAPSAARGAEPGAFLGDGVYTMAGGCRKLEALANGATPNVATVPEKLTRAGFESWEGDCTFLTVHQSKPGTWVAKLTCIQGGDEYEETTTFKKLDDSRFRVKTDGKSSEFALCPTAKGN
jgi:hypothetical protein